MAPQLTEQDLGEEQVIGGGTSRLGLRLSPHPLAPSPLRLITAHLLPTSILLQKLYVNNTLHGQKGLIMRLRVAFVVEGNGQRVEEQAEVSNFPPGL